MQKKMFILIVAVIIVFILGSGYLKQENRPKERYSNFRKRKLSE